jgi:predicted TIM-barrel fold metal-dependent hydrolase
MNSYGSNKVLFGTGYPLMDYETPLGEIEAMELKPDARDAFLGGNAARVLGWDGR